MSIGEGLGQGLMFLANQVAANKRSKKENEQALQMFNMKRAADLEDMQKQNDLKRQWQIEDENRQYGANEQANNAVLGLAGVSLPENFDKAQLKYVTPSQFNSVLDDRRNTEKTAKQEELKKQQSVYANKIYQNILSGAPLDPALLAEAEQAGVDTSKAFGFYQNRLDKQSDREDRQASAREMKQMQMENAKALKYLGASLKNSGGGGSGGGGVQYIEDPSSGEVLTVKTSKNGQKTFGKSGLTSEQLKLLRGGGKPKPAPVFNYNPTINR